MRAGLFALLATVTLSAGAARPAIYPDVSAAQADLTAAEQAAKSQHKRVLVDFGGNWCGDCIVLDRVFHQPENAALLDQRFVVVHVNVGEKGIDRNLDLAKQLGIPLEKGVPALAVLEADGRIVYSQKNGEFESMRSMDPQSVNDFLTRWSK